MTYSVIYTKCSHYSAVDDFKFNLQLFAGEKTEEATPKRKQEARDKGQVAKSTEVNSALIMLATFGFFNFAGLHFVENLQELMRYMFTELAQNLITVESVHTLAMLMILKFLKIVMPLMLLIAIVGVMVNYMQVGFMFNPKLLLPDFARVNPLSGFSRIFFSKTALVNLAKSLMKIMVIGYFIYTFVEKQLYILPSLVGNDINTSMLFFGNMIIDLGFRVCAVMMVIAVLDYLYQWYSNREKMMMSKQEVKDEYKQTEGNPQIKSKIRQKQREMAMQRMMQEVPKADVIITNPTHFAVALKYEDGMPAPVVVAKGKDNVALKIREIATENDVVIVENKSLARALYKVAEIGSFVPFELYQAVAEVLAYVYKLKRKLA